jgi:hypothetical protein
MKIVDLNHAAPNNHAPRAAARARSAVAPLIWRCALLVAALLLIATPTCAGFQLVAHTGASSATPATTPAIDTTGATLIIIAAADDVAPSVHDSAGNTWTPLTLWDQGTTMLLRLFYCVNPTTSTSHTFTAVGDLSGLAVEAWAGNAAVFDVENGNTATGASTIQTGALTPSHDGALIIAAAGHGPFSATIDSGFTKEDEWAGGSRVVTMAYLLQGSAVPVNPTFTGDPAQNYAAAIATFTLALVGRVGRFGTVFPTR